MPQGRKLFEGQPNADIDSFKQDLTHRHSTRIEEVVTEGKVQGSQNLPPTDQKLPPPYQAKVRALAEEGNASAQVAELRGAYHEQRALGLPLTLLMR
jgi:hypothetical protein